MDLTIKTQFLDRWKTYFPDAELPIIYHPYQELRSGHPRAVLGMFDVSARPCVAPDELTFAVPWPKFVEMVAQIDESFLITDAWRKVRARL